LITVAQALVIADDATGAAAVSTATPAKTYMEVDCQDANTCEWTLGETAVTEGTVLTIVNIATGGGMDLVIKDDPGVTAELGGDQTLTTNTYSTMTAIYTGDRWVRTSTAAN